MIVLVATVRNNRNVVLNRSGYPQAQYQEQNKLLDMNPIYTFDEFATHMEEITKLLGEERTPGEYAFERSVLRSSEYFKQYYTDERERVYKHGRFCLMMHYMSSHLKDFDRGDYAVFGSERVGALMSSHLLKAVHHVYTSDDILKRQSDPPPEEIMALAERFKESEL